MSRGTNLKNMCSIQMPRYKNKPNCKRMDKLLKIYRSLQELNKKLSCYFKDKKIYVVVNLGLVSINKPMVM